MTERLQEADRQQRELDRLRRDLVAWASHDLQTPLTAIRVQIEALADGVVDEPATVQRYLQTTKRQVNDLSLLLDDLFRLQLDAGGVVIRPAACSLSDLISDTLESFSALASERGVRLTGSAATDLDPAMLDAPHRASTKFTRRPCGTPRQAAKSGHRSTRRQPHQIDVSTGEGSTGGFAACFRALTAARKSRNRTGGSGWACHRPWRSGPRRRNPVIFCRRWHFHISLPA
jgi:hypothetical protein